MTEPVKVEATIELVEYDVTVFSRGGTAIECEMKFVNDDSAIANLLGTMLLAQGLVAGFDIKRRGGARICYANPIQILSAIAPKLSEVERRTVLPVAAMPTRGRVEFPKK